MLRWCNLIFHQNQFPGLRYVLKVVLINVLKWCHCDVTWVGIGWRLNVWKWNKLCLCDLILHLNLWLSCWWLIRIVGNVGAKKVTSSPTTPVCGVKVQHFALPTFHPSGGRRTHNLLDWKKRMPVIIIQAAVMFPPKSIWQNPFGL